MLLWPSPLLARLVASVARSEQKTNKLAQVIERYQGSILASTTLLRGRADALSISNLQAFFEQQLNLLTQGTAFLFRDFVQS
jgi:hypothetical protein